MRCLRSTDFPPPLRPMMTVMEPVGTSRESARSTCWRPKDFVSASTLIMRNRGPRSRQDRPHEVVTDEDQHGGEDDRLCRRARHALGAVADVEPLVRTDPRHDDTERDRLPEPRHDVGHVDERLHLAEVRALRKPPDLHTNEVAAEDPDDVE